MTHLNLIKEKKLLIYYPFEFMANQINVEKIFINLLMDRLKLLLK